MDNKQNIKKLENLIDYVIENVPFYKKYRGVSTEYVDIYRMFPVVSKYNYRNDMEQFISNKCNKNQIKKEFTSGSSGEPFCCYKSLNDFFSISYSITQQRMEKDKKFNPSDRYLRFYGSWQMKNIDRNVLLLSVFFLNDEHITEYVDSIISFEPKWIMITPSELEKLYELLKNNYREYIRFREVELYYIEVNGEMFNLELKEKYEEFFGCQIINLYGCQEIWHIATSCEYGKLHICTDNAYVETYDANGKNLSGEEGEIVVTGLNSKEIPFLKYNLGDIGKITYEKCRCGKNTPIIELSGARTSEFVYLENGEKLNSIFIYHIFRRLHDRGNDSIKNFYVKQENYKEFTFVLKVEQDYSRKVEDLIIMWMEQILNEKLKIRFEYINELGCLKSRKKKNFETFVKKN